MLQTDVKLWTGISKRSDATPCVFVVDDDPVVRDALEQLIDSAGWAVETYARAEDFLARPKLLRPGCVVVDTALPDANGLELQERLAAHRAAPIIFMTRFPDVPTTVRAMKAGAVEFLVKPLREDLILGAISQAIERSHAELRQEAELRALRERYTSLTRREREVLALVVAGRLNKQIAAELAISEITVKAHRGKVMRKMNARSLPALVRSASKLGVG